LTEHALLDTHAQFGRSEAVAKLAGFSFRRKGKLHVFHLLRVRRIGPTNSGNPVGGRETVVNRPLMQGSRKDATARHETQVKLRKGPGTVPRRRRRRRCLPHGHNRVVVIFNSVASNINTCSCTERRVMMDRRTGHLFCERSFCERLSPLTVESDLTNAINDTAVAIASNLNTYDTGWITIDDWIDWILHTPPKDLSFGS
jgi:hypothetical protein